jgi:hypothetical protein
MTVVDDAMAGIEIDDDVRKPIENAFPQLALARLLGRKLRYDDERDRATRLRELHGRAKNLPRDRDTALDRFLAAITDDSSCERQ